jgi:tetratricopeptide (TPR) repeat protein
MSFDSSQFNPLNITNPKRQASDSIRAYEYQIWQSVLRWVTLKPGEILFLEKAEDFDVINERGAETIQVKDTARSGSITLNTASVIEAISNFWNHQLKNPNYFVRFKFITTSPRGTEKLNPFNGIKGLDYWDQCKGINTDLEPLREFLINNTALPEELRRYISSSSDEDFRSNIICRIEWASDQGDHESIKEAIKKRVIAYGMDTHSLQPAESEKVIPHLFTYVLKVIREREHRQLTLADFGIVFEEHTTRRLTHQEIQNIKAGSSVLGGAQEASEPVIHSLPLGDVQGREMECGIILQEVRNPNGARILGFAAPGGFGKTALLAKLIKEKISDKGRIIESTIQAILHIDCRRGVKMLDVFAKAGRLVGKEQTFQQLYTDPNSSLQEKLSAFFRWLAPDINRTIWIVFDNFETVLDEGGRFAEQDLQQFFETCLLGEQGVRFLIASRVLPQFSPRSQSQILVLNEVSKLLFDGLPPEDCITYLRKNGATRGLTGSEEEIDSTLLSFAKRVHHIPMALVWAVGYMNDRQGMTLSDLLAEDFFSDFDKYQYTNSPNYLDKGLKRLHYEQLTIQPPEALFLLHLLAFFNRPTPRAALEHLMSPPKLLETLTRLSNNKLIGRREVEDKRTQFAGNDSMTPLYTLHPVICENIYFKQLSQILPIDISPINENTAMVCDERAILACGQSNFDHAIRLFELAEAICKYLITEHNRQDVLVHIANILGNKGVALSRLNRFSEALQAFDSSLTNYQTLKECGEFGEETANRMAATLMNKGEALRILGYLDEAFDCHNSAVDIRRQLVKLGNTDLEGDLAWALINKAVLLDNLSRYDEAISFYDEAILLLRKLINRGLKQHKELLALALLDKGVSVAAIDQTDEAIKSYNEAINIFRYLEKFKEIKEEKFFALALKNKGDRVRVLDQRSEALKLYDEAITILETSLTNGRAEYADDLANICLVKAELLEEHGSSEEIIALCGRAIELWLGEVAGKQMIRCMASILRTSRLRLLSLIRLDKWQDIGADIALFLLAGNQSEEIELANDIQQEIDETRKILCELPESQLDLLFENSGDVADILKYFLFAQ